MYSRENERSGQIVRSIRERVGLTQGEFAERLGLKPRTISNWELGLRSLPTQQRVYRSFGEIPGVTERDVMSVLQTGPKWLFDRVIKPRFTISVGGLNTPMYAPSDWSDEKVQALKDEIEPFVRDFWERTHPSQVENT